MLETAKLNSPQTVLESTIQPATELVKYTDKVTGMDTGLLKNMMTGGGKQITPAAESMSKIDAIIFN